MSSQGTGRLQGKVAIVTGGGAGFGAGIVKKFTMEGAHVLIVDVNKDNAESIASSCPKGSAVAFQGDVTSEKDWRSALETTVKKFGKLDVVVNNAGVVHRARASHEVPEEDFDRMFAIHVKPLYLSTKVIIPHWKEQGKGGLVINVSSISEPRPRPNLVWYDASKGAVSVATRGLSVEYAKDNIRYNAIRPSAGETGMVPNVLGGSDTPEGRERILATVPLGRLSTPEDVGNVACFLASDEASYMTGACVDIDGGRGV
ncbi:oxidoreductase [Cryomyces antarcticus]